MASSIILRASQDGDWDTVETLLRDGGEPDTAMAARDAAGWTPLHYAVWSWRGKQPCPISVISTMLELGWDANETTAMGRSALHFALSDPKCSVELVELLLLRGGANPN